MGVVSGVGEASGPVKKTVGKMISDKATTMILETKVAILSSLKQTKANADKAFERAKASKKDTYLAILEEVGLTTVQKEGIRTKVYNLVRRKKISDRGVFSYACIRCRMCFDGRKILIQHLEIVHPEFYRRIVLDCKMNDQDMKSLLSKIVMTAPYLRQSCSGEATPWGTPVPSVYTPIGTPTPPGETPIGSPIPPEDTLEGTHVPQESTPGGTPLPPESTPEGTPLPPEDTPEGTAEPQESTPGVTPKPSESTPGGTPLPPEDTPEGTAEPQESIPGGAPEPSESTPGGTPLPPEDTPEGTPEPPEDTPEGTPEPQESTPGRILLPPEDTPGGIPVPVNATIALIDITEEMPSVGFPGGTLRPPENASIPLIDISEEMPPVAAPGEDAAIEGGVKTATKRKLITFNKEDASSTKKFKLII